MYRCILEVLRNNVLRGVVAGADGIIIPRGPAASYGPLWTFGRPRWDLRLVRKMWLAGHLLEHLVVIVVPFGDIWLLIAEGGLRVGLRHSSLAAVGWDKTR